jgi:hypothetical protein
VLRLSKGFAWALDRDLYVAVVSQQSISRILTLAARQCCLRRVEIYTETVVIAR